MEGDTLSYCIAGYVVFWTLLVGYGVRLTRMK